MSPDPERGVAAREISREEALAIALDNADVPEGDAYNIKNETDSDSGIPIYDIEFETDYGDYDFEVAMADGRIVGADYEVDEEWLEAIEEEAREDVKGTFLQDAPIVAVSSYTGQGIEELKQLIVKLVDGAPEINLAGLLWEEFVLALPVRPLCKPDCKGLCPDCGKNLNEGSCSCVRDEGDPRLAALRGLKVKKN